MLILIKSPLLLQLLQLRNNPFIV